MSKKKSINMLLLDEAVTGRIRASIANWTGVVFKVPRNSLEESKGRPELQNTGVYLLFGESESNREGCVYIGQAIARANGNGILGRITEHDKNPDRDYWQEAIVITTTDDSLGATEISYLENQLYRLAKQANRYDVMNGNEPNSGNVTETKEAEMGAFLANAVVLVGMLGHRVFESLSPSGNTNSREFYLKLGAADARMRWTDEGFVLLKGSQLSLKVHPSCPDRVKRKREELKRSFDSSGILQEDLLFKSPSGASIFCLNRPSNGRIDWKDNEGKPLQDYLSDN